MARLEGKLGSASDDLITFGNVPLPSHEATLGPLDYDHRGGVQGLKRHWFWQSSASLTLGIVAYPATLLYGVGFLFSLAAIISGCCGQRLSKRASGRADQSAIAGTVCGVCHWILALTFLALACVFGNMC